MSIHAANAIEVRQALSAGETTWVRVVTASMAPTVAVGDRVRVRAGRPRIGDVVLVDCRGELVLHRLVASLAGRFFHAGDAPGAGAGLCRIRDLVGVAELERVPPRLGRRLLLAAGGLWRAARARLG